MIIVKELTKKFGSVKAVDNISFEIPSGEIVGFLGVNGAGKSTTMRMINSYLSPTSGQILIDGFCTFKNSLQARKKIGYMAENNPLPTELRVVEYLKFRAALKKVPINKTKNEVQRVMQECLINDVDKKVIGVLSKGYRQRVALADALLNDPPILLLDEPTVGLDPNQIGHIRNLIKSTVEKKTVIISTHIMQEVESICTNIIFLHKGRVALNDSLDKLKKELGKSNTIKVSASCDEDKVKILLEAMPGIINHFSHKSLDVNHFTIETDGNLSTQAELFKIFTNCNSTIYEFKKVRTNLEDIFLKVTGNKHIPHQANVGAKS